MHRHTLSETGDMASARSSRAPSFSSDRPSVASSITFQMPSTVRPSPAYIAASVASQMVTDHHNAQLREEDADSDDLESAVFSEQALALLNAFLDHLLFAFLSSARAPALTAIRPAIADVLKPRLAREATEAADEELQGLLAGEDEGEDEGPAQHGRAPDRWDVEKVWKRTRLRVMVYTRLGELEDEDEEKYVQQERGLSMDDDDDDESGLVSWASAIFLTSVVEYVAEQTLLAAGAAAFTRTAAKMKKLAQQPGSRPEQTFERLVIEEPDVEKIALNSALGRLWRTWRKRVRSPLSPMSPGRGIHPVSSYSSLHRRRTSHDTVDDIMRTEHASSIPEHEPSETEIAANIPCPVGANDVAEIEVPGLARTFEDNESIRTQTPVPRSDRPSSVLVLASPDTFRRRNNKDRPFSMPVPPPMPFTVPPLFSGRPTSSGKHSLAETGETPFETPFEHAPKRTSYTNGQVLYPSVEKKGNASQDFASEPPSEEDDAEMVAFAASTGVDPAMNTVPAIETGVKEKIDEEEVHSAGGYESEPKIMNFKRMSVEKKGPPGIVRTFSTRSQRSSKSPAVTPKALQSVEGRSYLDDGPSDDDDDEIEHKAIGVARTSDIPIQQTPTPPIESPYTEKGKHVSHTSRGSVGSHGGYVEVQPRQTAPTNIAVQGVPPSEPKPAVPDKSQRRRSVDEEPATVAHTVSPPREQEPVQGHQSRGASLPSLKEVLSHPNSISHGSNYDAVAGAQDGGRSRSDSRQAPAQTDRETPVTPVTPVDRATQQRTGTAHSHRSKHEGSPSSEKASLQRVGSIGSGRRSGSLSNKHGSRASESSQRPARMSEEDREREFDSLVKGDETVKYTLTPQNMRDYDGSPIQRKVEPVKAESPSVTVHPRVSAERDNAFGTANLPARTSSRSKGHTPTPVSSQMKASPSRKVVTRPLAREPQIRDDSMRDFADFIRSTGPQPGHEKPVQPFVNISSNGHNSTNASSSSLSRKTSVKQGGTRPMGGPSANLRMNMEPRSPAGLSKGNDDLIDFIRQGPPSSNQGQPRIPRNVAPFRTTVDSDQFDTMLGSHANVESAYGSTASTLDSKASAQTINSRTGLLPEPKVVQPAYSNQPPKLHGNMNSNEPVITKTRRRIKDPYAIDFSDEDEEEDEDELTALPASSHSNPSLDAVPPVSAPRSAPRSNPKPSPVSRQESLMDFLNGMEPPSSTTSGGPQPFFLSDDTIAKARARAAAGKNASSSSLSSTNTAQRHPGGPSSSFGQISTIGSDAPRAYKPRLQARASETGNPRAGQGRTGTSDLAKFLRESGPPEPVDRPALARKESNGGEEKKRRFWSRNKKTYGDLP